MSFSSDLDRLEQSGQWTQAIEMLRQKLSCGEAVDADRLHAMGRLYQRLGVFARAERAYLASYVWMLNGLSPATTSVSSS